MKEINNPPCIKTLARIILTNRIEVLKMENTAELLKVLHHDEKIDNVCGDEKRKDSLVNNKKGKGVFYAVINYNPCHGDPHLGNRIIDEYEQEIQKQSDRFENESQRQENYKKKTKI